MIMTIISIVIIIIIRQELKSKLTEQFVQSEEEEGKREKEIESQVSEGRKWNKSVQSLKMKDKI